MIWLAVSDHGLMGTNRDLHPHPRPTTPPPLTGAYKDSDNPLSGGLFSLRDGERYLYGSGKLNGLKTQYRSEMEVFFRRVLEQNPDDFPQDQTTNTVWYDRPIPRGDGTFIPALEALWAPQLPVPVSAIYSPDGGLAHIYVRERTGDSNWNQVSGGVAGNDTRQLAWYLAKESLGDFSQFPGGKPLMPKDESNPALGSQFQDALAFKDGTATVAGVFVLVGTKYQRAVPLDGLGEVNLIDIDDSMTGGASWKILKTRLDEMARQTGVSRSGDIVLIFNIRGSYATVNDATEEELNGWHGSPTQAESVTPLVYATPGYGWYQSDNSSLPTSAQSTSSSEGKYRNSDVRGSLEALIKSVTGR